jgi:hypothetical protein
MRDILATMEPDAGNNNASKSNNLFAITQIVIINNLALLHHFGFVS